MAMVRLARSCPMMCLSRNAKISRGVGKTCARIRGFVFIAASIARPEILAKVGSKCAELQVSQHSRLRSLRLSIRRYRVLACSLSMRAEKQAILMTNTKRSLKAPSNILLLTAISFAGTGCLATHTRAADPLVPVATRAAGYRRQILNSCSAR